MWTKTRVDDTRDVCFHERGRPHPGENCRRVLAIVHSALDSFIGAETASQQPANTPVAFNSANYALVHWAQMAHMACISLTEKELVSTELSTSPKSHTQPQQLVQRTTHHSALPVVLVNFVPNHHEREVVLIPRRRLRCPEISASTNSPMCLTPHGASAILTSRTLQGPRLIHTHLDQELILPVIQVFKRLV